MVEKLDTSKLEKVTQQEYELNLSEMILSAKKELDDILEVYNRYSLIDKDNYKLTFYKNKQNVYMYTRDKKQTIGFKNDKS